MTLSERVVTSLNERAQQALMNINRALATGVSSEQVSETIVREAASLFQAERGLLLHSSGQVVATCGTVDEGYSQGVVDLVLANAEPLLTADAPSDPRLDSRRSILDHGIRSIIAAPLQADRRVIGVIYLDARSSRRNFAPEDMYLLAALADQAVVAYKLATLKLELESQQQTVREMSQLALKDGLTGLMNRRAFDLEIEAWLADPARTPFCLMMLDVDDFKHYNDHNGHPAGDEVLRSLAALFTQNLRKRDLAARYGGEEFIVALPRAGEMTARMVAERLRQAVARAYLPGAASQPRGRLSVSSGLALFPHHGGTLPELVAAADSALYGAKRAGKNRVALYG